MTARKKMRIRQWSFFYLTILKSGCRHRCTCRKQGSLVKLFLKADEGDRTGYERIRDLLNRVCEVNCTAFLKELANTDNPASVHLAAGLLKTNGNREYIDRLAAKIFAPSFRENTREHYSQIYTEAVECICLRGSDTALKLLNTELEQRYGEAEISAVILPLLPVRGETVFIPTLTALLKKDDISRSGAVASDH